MKRISLCLFLIVAIGVMNHAQAQFRTPDVAWGLSLGGAQGDNSGSDKWVMQYRGFLQVDVMHDYLVGQVGLGFTELYAPNVYSSATGMADVRLLFSPFSLPNLNPYVYGGFGVSKALSGNGNDVLAMIPLGVGIQTRLSRGILLQINGGYALSLSDQLDGRVRPDNDLNSVTNAKQDGFYGFTVGVAFSLGSGYDASADLKNKDVTDAEARRVKELADAQAQRVKEQADNEARMVKMQADAEAQRVKALADAEARRLAGQKGHDTDTVFVFTQGKTIILRGVNFEFNKAAITNESDRILWRAYRAMMVNPEVQVVITGHTDNVGGTEFNQGLSLERAQTVRNWLVQKGIASNRMRTVGRGENETVASNETDEGRAENRRIEFYVQK